MLKSKIIKYFILTACLVNYLCSFAQEVKKSNNGFGIEAGAGYNTTSWKYTNVGEYSSLNFIDYMQAFWVQPTARISYSINLYNLPDSLYKKIKMPIFIGYYTFGGAINNPISILEDPISKNIILFRSIELGINPCFEKKIFQLGFLFKGQYILSVRNRTYHDPFWNNGVTLEESNISSDYKKFAMNTGIKIKCKIVKGLSIACEAWVGITNLYAHKSYGSNGKLNVKENNYRLLLGYEF